jgi:hypothetical protein
MVKVRLAQPQFSYEYGGKVPAGGVVDLPEDVAERWDSIGLIAGKAAQGAKTYRQERREALQKELAALGPAEADDQEGSAAWDVEARDVGRQEAAVEAAEAQVDRAEAARKAAPRPSRRGNEPGPVNEP